MTHTGLAACCVSGVKHEGDPVGQTTSVGGITSYLTYPPDKSTKNCILYIPDAFGLPFVNNKLLADDLARAGYFVVMPDIFEGDPVPESVLTNHASFDGPTWFGKHPVKRVDEIVGTAIKGVKSEFGPTKLGAVGFCFGAKYVLRFLAAGKGVDVGFVAHPTGIEDAEVEAVAGPLSIAAAEVDQVFPTEKRRASEDILIKGSVPYQIVLYGDTEHGFAVRTDLKDPKKKFAKESAYFQAIRWFDQFLKE